MACFRSLRNLTMSGLVVAFDTRSFALLQCASVPRVSCSLPSAATHTCAFHANTGARVCAPPGVRRSAARVPRACQDQSCRLGGGGNGLRLRGGHGAPANLCRLFGGLRYGAREEAGRRVKAARRGGESNTKDVARRWRWASGDKGLSIF